MSFPKFSCRTAMVALMGGLVSTSFGQWGGLDATLTPFPGVGGLVNSAIPDGNGNILLIGQFDEIRAVEADAFTKRYGVAKFTNGGFLIQDYLPNVNARAYNAVVNPDGSTFVAGDFDKVNFVTNTTDPGTKTRYRIAKFDKTGLVDPWFVPQTSGLTGIFSMAPTLSGRMIISSHGGLYQLKEDGVVTEPPEFYPYQGFAVYGAAVRTDQKIFAWGPMPGANQGGNGINSNYLDLVSQTGRYTVLGPLPYQPDMEPYSPQLSAAAHAAVVLPDGNVLVGGLFSSPRVGFVKLLTTKGVLPTDYAGRPDPDFLDKHKVEVGQPFIDGNVEAIAVQADGRILIGGGFTRVRGPVKVNGLWEYHQRYGIARLNVDGTLDTTFNANIQPAAGKPDSIRVLGIALQADGKVLITGLFERFGPTISQYTTRPLVARLTNYSATSTLSTNGNSITWLRGGSAPEATSVILEWRPANSPNWMLVDDLGIAVRTTGGWTRTLSQPIPPFSYVRASARTTGGRYNGSSGLVTETIGYLIPNAGLRRESPFAPLPSGGTTDLGTAGISWPKSFNFTLSNSGDAAMTGISALITGTDSSQFSIQTAPTATLASQASAPIVVRFTPTSVGSKTATLRINSNDPDTPAYLVTLTGTGVSAIEGFRLEYFNTLENSGDAADAHDADGDGQSNFFEYVAGLIPTNKDSKFVQSVDFSTGVPKVVFSPVVSGRSYEVWTSATLGDDWVLATGTTANAGDVRTFTHTGVADPKRFYRVKIIK